MKLYYLALLVALLYTILSLFAQIRITAVYVCNHLLFKNHSNALDKFLRCDVAKEFIFGFINFRFPISIENQNDVHTSNLTKFVCHTATLIKTVIIMTIIN